MTSKLVVNTIEADTGISSVSFASSISLSSTSKFFFSDAGIDIGPDTNINRPASGVLGFNINSSEKLRITSDGKIGIGTNNPSTILHLRDDSNDCDLTVQATASGKDARINLYGHSGGVSQIRLGDEADGNVGLITYDHSDNSLQLRAGDAERLRIDSAGNVGVGTNVASDTTGNCRAFKIARTVNGQVRLIIQNTATGFGNGAGFQQGIDGANVFIENRTSGGFIDFANVDSGGTYYSRMRISSEGFVTKPYQAMFEAGGNNIAFSAQSPLPYPTVKYNIGNCYNNSTYKFTAPVNGYYQVMAHVIPTDYTAGGNNVELYVMDNHGTRYFLDRKVKSTNYSSNNFSVGGTRIIYADATDTLWLQFHAISGTPKVETASYFSIMLVA